MLNPRLLAVFALLATGGCRHIGALEALGGRCEQEQLVATWHVTITRGTTVSSPLLTTTVTPGNVSGSEFNTLRSALVDGSSAPYNVTWSLPAFGVNGGHISLRHAVPLTAGETQQVGATFTGGGWGAQPVGAALPPAVSVNAGDFTATSASGSFTVLSAAPLRLNVDVTVRNAAGETIRLTGDPGFAYQKVTKTCVP
jgi:hypothetical protein